MRREGLVDLSVRCQIDETREAALVLQSLSRAQEGGPSPKGERTADADAPDAERRDVADPKPDVANDEEVEWSWMDRFHERLDFLGLLRTRCKEHIGARLCVHLETANRFA